MNPETPFQYCCVNCVSIIPVPPWRSRERKIVYVGALNTEYVYLMYIGVCLPACLCEGVISLKLELETAEKCLVGA